MTIHYPGGKKYQPTSHNKEHVHYGKRGMTLEEDINMSNDYYLSVEKAVIYKKPTPVQIVNVDYPKRSAAVITEAYFRKPSTTDYNGVYRGRYIDFETKETKQKQSFPLKNFHHHQIKHMQQVLQQQGICFVLLKFSSTDDIYLLDAAILIQYWKDQAYKQRKSIKKREVAADGYLVPQGYRPRIDYLNLIDRIYLTDDTDQ